MKGDGKGRVSRRTFMLKAVPGAVAAGWGISLVSSRKARDVPSAATIPPEAFRYDLEEFARVDPGLVRYRETVPILTGQENLAVLALSGGGQQLFVGAGRAVLQVVSGRGHEFVSLDSDVTALAAGPDGIVYAAGRRRIYRIDPAGKPEGEPVDLGEGAWLASMAMSDHRLFAADAGNRLVWVFDGAGRLLGNIQGRGPGSGKTGFIIPSPSFEVVSASGGRVWIVNPGLQRVELYSEDGQFLKAWGRSSFEIDGFAGCCNPVSMALLADGRFVTSEKGLPRVKVYTPEGVLESVVAGTDVLDSNTAGLPVAADREGRILALDRHRGMVRVFEPLTGDEGRRT